jgi:glyoxylase-like metal-dependent hydrolase (beta-lactamase superfamily II)
MAPFAHNDEPECIEEGLWRIPLPLPFALRSVNVYLVEDAPGTWTLIDSGLGLPADQAALHAGLARAGIVIEAIATLVLTHAHPDHIGLSGAIAAASGAPVYLLAGEDERLYHVWGEPNEGTQEGDGTMDQAGAQDAHDAQQTQDARDDGVFAQVEAMYRANGLSADDVAQHYAGSQRLRRILRLPPRSATRTLDDDQTLRLGAHSYRVLWTPGHSDFHLCLLRDDGLFFAGDHVLPGITPNIGLYPNARPNPLRDYLGALARVRDLSVRYVLPGHRRPFADLAGRVDELQAHHEERAARLLALLAAHPDGADANTLAGALFGMRLNGPDDRRFALAETLAHLEHLHTDGRVARQEREGLIIYRTASA